MKTLRKYSALFICCLTIILGVFPAYANMAKPYSDGTESSILFGSKNCSVLSERIDLTAIAPIDEDDYVYQIKYKISYRIASPQNGMLPLLFVAKNRSDQPIAVFIDGKRILLDTLNKQNVSQFQFIKPSASGGDFYDIQFERNNQEWGIQLSDLIYFEADLSKGENVITVEYEGYPEFNTYGVLREYKIQYALYPSNHWKSFGPIEVNINLPKQAEISDVNIGELKDLGNGKYKLLIDKITDEDLEIRFSRKISLFAKFMLSFHPIGLPIIALLLAVFFHFKWIKRRRQNHPFKYNFAVLIGALLVTILTFGVFIIGFDLMHWIIGDLGLKDGYALAVVLTAPFFFLFYLLIMWFVDMYFKKRIQSYLLP